MKIKSCGFEYTRSRGSVGCKDAQGRVYHYSKTRTQNRDNFRSVAGWKTNVDNKIVWVLVNAVAKNKNKKNIAAKAGFETLPCLLIIERSHQPTQNKTTMPPPKGRFLQNLFDTTLYRNIITFFRLILNYNGSYIPGQSGKHHYCKSPHNIQALRKAHEIIGQFPSYITEWWLQMCPLEIVGSMHIGSTQRIRTW